MLLKNKSLILFMCIGFLATLLVWGFVGGCGSTSSHIKAGPSPQEGPSEAEGPIFSETADSGDVYIVSAGDTLWGISRKFGVSISAIKEANSLAEDSISIGQKLIIPGMKKEPAAVCPEPEPEKPEVTKEKPNGDLVMYKVRKGDSIWRIAQIYGTTIERIAQLNGIQKNTQLKPGQEILVPNTGN